MHTYARRGEGRILPKSLLFITIRFVAICPVCEHDTKAGWQCEQCGRELRMSPERLQAKKLKVSAMSDMVSTHAEKVDVEIVPTVDVLRPNGSAGPDMPAGAPGSRTMTPPEMPAVPMDTLRNSEHGPVSSLPLGPDARSEGWVEDHLSGRDALAKSANEDVQSCVSCGVQNPRNASFCKACSYQLPLSRTRRDGENEVRIRCKSCGRLVDPDSICRDCGIRAGAAVAV